MPAMMAISEKYGMSKTIAGIFIAVGVTLPEVIVTMLSF
jgi:Ca2+/Na+ antiporter